MPNWCDNIVTLSHTDKAKIDALEAELSKEDGGEFFNSLLPNPAGEWQYDWSVENWGTKWDAGIIDWERSDDTTIWVSFDSAWSPPTRLYDYLSEQGWTVSAIYYESGMSYGGVYESENGGDDYYEIDWSSRENIVNLPSELIEFGDLLNKFEEYQIENIKEEWADAERTDWFPIDVTPVRDGYYEVQVKGWEDHIYEELIMFSNGQWDFWNNDNIVGWRGLAEEPEIV